ncbi:MAG: bifunctional folylpolyglutamate synthase/dihydrofolate synthase [Pirellulaceae bacterium]|nr:bifunctional folylpolyglutamate synthase/dihydrofolate synthase [Pirellulaceae bacterium]
MPELSQETAYDQTIRSLYERINYEKIGHAPYSDANYRLDRMRRLLAELNNPHLAAPVIHIAGTKGKGSTATLISRMLAATGYRTGLYTSPHLIRLEERFQLNNHPCTPDQLVKLVEETAQAAERVEADGGGRATFFELTTAVAFLFFAQQQAQAVVLEVGLGGRLDSTNVCQPIATVITTIGLDHQAQLGNTIAAIAGEKAGIIKPNVPIISSARHPDARQVIAERAALLSAPLRLLNRDFLCQWSPLVGDIHMGELSEASSTNRISSPTAQAIFQPQYTDSLVGTSAWYLSLLGPHHADNLAAALAAMDILAQQGWSIQREALPAAVQNTTVPARLQIVGQQPMRLIDTAHNPDSIAATISALNVHFPQHLRTIVLATSRDKDIESMLKLIVTNCDRLILTQYHNNPRGLPIEELVAKAHALQPSAAILTAPTPEKAWRLALELVGKDELVCATGSFFLAAELLS